MLPNLLRSRVLAAPAWKSARRHGSGGGANRPIPDFGKPVWPDGHWPDKLKLFQKGTNPLGDDLTGVEGMLGKFALGMFGLSIFLSFFPGKTAHHDHH